MAIKMTEKHAARFKRYADWSRIEREVVRYINEDNDMFSVDLGGFKVEFDGTKGADNGK